MMSEGKNVYKDLLTTFGSIAEAKEQAFATELPSSEPCIFLSHLSVDKDAVRALSEHIKKAGIDFYLDIEDRQLQTAIKARNHKSITSFIEVGIQSSTDVMVILSEDTKAKTWWVPYELGFGKCGKKILTCLKLKSVATEGLSFLEIVRCLKTTKELDDYLKQVLERKRRATPLLEASEKKHEIIVDIAGQWARAGLAEMGGSHPMRPYMD